MMTQTRSAQNQTNQNQTARPAAQPTVNAQSAAAVALEEKQAPVIEMHEAPYSWNVAVQDANGFIEMFTVRAVSEKGFRERVARVKAQLLAENYTPAPTRGASATAHADEAQPENAAAPLCAIHKTPMQKRQGKRGESFYSCPQRLDNGEFCPYRPPKQ